MNFQAPPVFISLVAWISFLIAPSAETASTQTRIPQIGEIAGIKVGYTTREQLEKRWGKGKGLTGGHPNGARLWRVKGTTWMIYADAFDYSDKGIVLDRLDLSMNPKPIVGVPFARVTTNDLAWLGGICLGMSKEKVLETLKREGFSPRQSKDGWAVNAPGYYRLNQETYELWTAELKFNSNRLNCLSLGAEVKPRSH